MYFDDQPHLTGLRVYRYREGCLIAQWAPIPPDLPAVVGPWDAYDYESDPWAIWACITWGGNLGVAGCSSHLPHYDRIAELSATHSPPPRRIDLGEHQ